MVAGNCNPVRMICRRPNVIIGIRARCLLVLYYGSNLALFDGGVVGESSKDRGFLGAFGSAVMGAVSSISLVATALIAVLLLSERLETMIPRGKWNFCGKLANI